MNEVRKTEFKEVRNLIEYELQQIQRKADQIGFLSVRGIWLIGSDGNKDAEVLANIITEIVKDGSISKIILDLSELSYRFGNSFLEFVTSAFKENRNFEYIIIANGETEKWLISLLDSSGLKFGFKGIYHDKKEGLESI